MSENEYDPSMGTDPEFSEDIIAPHAIELIERGQIDSQVATAHKFPRNPVLARKRMLSIATMDEETASACFYTLKRRDAQTRQDKFIQGPGIRLAEIAFSQWGNIRGGARVIDNDGKVITSQGVCHDLETNAQFSMYTQRRITDRNGKTYNEDMQVTTGNAANSIAFRNAVFKIVPASVIKSVLDAAKAVAVGKAGTFAEKRDKIFARLLQMGVSQERVLATLERPGLEVVDLADLETLIGLGTAIKDGQQTVEEAFPFVAGSAKSAHDVADSKKADLKADLKKAGDILKDQNNQTTEQSGSSGGEATTDHAKTSASTDQPATEATDKASASPAPDAQALAPHLVRLLELGKKIGDPVVMKIIDAYGFSKMESVTPKGYAEMKDTLDTMEKEFDAKHKAPKRQLNLGGAGR